jgi:hypothetical protein
MQAPLAATPNKDKEEEEEDSRVEAWLHAVGVGRIALGCLQSLIGHVTKTCKSASRHHSRSANPRTGCVLRIRFCGAKSGRRGPNSQLLLMYFVRRVIFGMATTDRVSIRSSTFSAVEILPCDAKICEKFSRGIDLHFAMDARRAPPFPADEIERGVCAFRDICGKVKKRTTVSSLLAICAGVVSRAIAADPDICGYVCAALPAECFELLGEAERCDVCSRWFFGRSLRLSVKSEVVAVCSSECAIDVMAVSPCVLRAEVLRSC